MPDGGIISVQGRNVAVPFPDGPPLPAGIYVRITVQDQGIGLDHGHAFGIAQEGVLAHQIHLAFLLSYGGKLRGVEPIAQASCP